MSTVVAKGLCMSTAHSTFRISNRKRWANNDLAVSQLGLLACVHDLLSRTYKRWLRMVDARERQAAPPESGIGPARGDFEARSAHAAARPLLAIDAMPAQEPMDFADDAGDGQDVHLPDPGMPEDFASGSGGADTSTSPAADWAQQNARCRTLASTWLGSRPLLDLICSRLVMEPCVAYLRKQLKVGSAEWERQQQLLSMDPAAAGGRDFRLLISARGDLDIQFQAHQRALVERPTLWALLDPASATESSLCLVFVFGCSRELAPSTSACSRRLIDDCRGCSSCACSIPSWWRWS